LDIKTYCDGELYERCGNYLVLKGMVAHWEKKIVDADKVEKMPQTKENYITVLSAGDPRRYLPDPPILFTMKECTQVCYMAQQLTKTFVETPELFDDFPPELRFLEASLAIQGGTALRKYMIDEFCPAEDITPEALREGMRRLLAQLDNMQTDPYADISNVLERLTIAMAIGSEEERDPFVPYVANKDPNGPGGFQTYTFNHDKKSLVRFLDSQYEGVKGDKGKNDQSALGGFFSQFGGSAPAEPAKPKKDTAEQTYKVPPARAAGRPHELGWLDMFKDEEKDVQMRLGKVPPGRIIAEDDA
jgi:hypothetical protein